MEITSMEVIRPGVVAVGVLLGEKIELTYGDTLKVNVSFDYRGLGETVTLFGAIGRSGFPGEKLLDEGSFIKHLTGEQSIDLPLFLEFTPVPASVDIPITTEISPGTNYDLYVKLVEYRKEAGMPEVDDIIDIPPEYELIQETIYPYAYIYDGDAELVTATFKTDPFTPADWIADKVASKLEEEAKKEGGRVLEVRVWVDKTPLFWTDFRIEVVSTPLRETAGGAPRQTGIPLWATVIIIALAIIAIIMVTYHFIIKPLTYKHKPISEKLKKTWPKPTLISVTNAFEIELGLTPKPAAELEGMSDQELRDYCDMLAEEIAPPGIDWLPWVIGAGVGILGLGTVAVLVKKKK
ncbi:unnamed protein product [marine sediment metagenome]|uniref:Uncharacterized protein n=1 Tax=marine sediment metagenome TaxID=412755 RepID=X1S0H7_9ZZZZ